MTSPRAVAVREFRAELAHYLHRVQWAGETIVITSNGHPVAQLVAFADRPRILKKLGVKRLPRPIGG